MSNKLNILIACHSKNEQNAQMIIDVFNQKNLTSLVCILATETSPDKLSTRSSLVLNCDAFVVLTSIDYQKSLQQMELLNFAKDVKAKIFAMNFFSPYKPFGALGAICASSQLGVIQLHNPTFFQDGLDNFLAALSNLQRKSSNEFSNRPVTALVNLVDLNQNSDVLISYHSNQKDIADILNEGLKSLNCLMEDSTNGRTSVYKTKVLLLVLSSDYEANFSCRAVVEAARMLNKKIIPISTSKSFKPTSWLGLVIAGKLSYRIFNREQAFATKYDSTPMNDLKVATTIALQPVLNIDEKEKALIASLEKKIEECRQKLDIWPPPRLKRDYIEEKPVKINLSEPKATHEFNHIHYTVSRIDFAIPKELFDNYGVPLRRNFDCMISYQWSTQVLVREVYMDLHMNSLNIWFDIWGNMLGNCNDSMATAVECSKVLLVFLNDQYQKSENCKLEFKYAVYRGKPFIFIVVEPNLKIEEWIEPYYNAWPKFEVFSIEDLDKMHNGVPRLHVISQAIREIGAAQIENLNFDLSDKVIELRSLLDDALDELALRSNKPRFKVCTRCQKQFDENNMSGCRKHTAYYLGGAILEGRWVCCSQQKQDSVGCRDVDHIDIERVWKMDEDYGTYTWEPP